MPAKPGAFIQSDRGTRRLLHDELCIGLGVPKPWVREYPEGPLVQQKVALHLLEYLTPLLLRPVEAVPAPVPEPSTIKLKTVQICADVGEFIVFTWKPPDLSLGSAWTKETTEELREACNEYDDAKELFQDGIKRMTCHRGNYDEEGPNPPHLQLLYGGNSLENDGTNYERAVV
jgi:hypothetical protein